MLVGELAKPRQALLPVLAAVGGMAVPAILYLALNAGGAGARGWGVPIATDIAFALGVLALLGSRAPANLKVLSFSQLWPSRTTWALFSSSRSSTPTA